MNFVVTIVAVLSTINSVCAAGSRPEIVDDILPEVKRLGQTAYLNCSVINLVPPATVQWIKKTTSTGESLTISSDETVKIDEIVNGKRKYDVVKIRSNHRDMFQLIIRALTVTDSGMYSCRIYIPDYSWQAWPVKDGTLTVQIPPTIEGNITALITVNEGGNITLNCDATGIPSPNITWKRVDGLPLPNGGFQHRAGTYQLLNIDGRDRGEFICIADNNVKPPADYTVEVIVRFRPKATAIQDTVGQAQNLRFNAKLDCLVEANPRANVVWYKENRPTRDREQIQDNDKYDLNQKEDERLKADEKWYTLLIKSVQGNDYGDYYCTATNQFGTGEAKFRLFETNECQGCPPVDGTGPVVTTMLEKESETTTGEGFETTLGETTTMEMHESQNTPISGSDGETLEVGGNGAQHSQRLFNVFCLAISFLFFRLKFYF